MTKSVLLGLALIGATVVSGVVHGLETGRWGADAALKLAADRVNRVPGQFGNWVSDGLEIPEREQKAAGADAVYWRHFVNTNDAFSTISVMLLTGRTGPIACHPPTVCFVGAGYRLLSKPTKVEIEGTDHAFWVGDFESTTFPKNQLRAYWAWSSGDGFAASGSPRHEFAGTAQLYKLYLTRVSRVLDVPPTEDPVVAFAREFLPILNDSLFDEHDSSGKSTRGSF